MAQITTTLPAGLHDLDNVPDSGDQIEQALTGSGIGMWDWDLVSGRASYSPLNNRMLGYDAGEIGETFAEQAAKIHPDDARAMQAKVDQHLRGETASYRTEFRVLRKDGTYAWFESRGMVVEHGPNGEPRRMIGTHIDISDRKANEQLRRDLETALRRNRDELAAMVRQQTQKLVDAADAAELGHRAKSALLANLGEEFRAPLDIVTGASAQLLAQGGGEIPPDIREPLERIQRAARLLSDTLQRLLDVRSIETDALDLCPTQVNLRRVLEEQCEEVENQALERGLDLRTVICDEDLVVFADRARLAQVVRELLNNAIKFTDNGHIQVRTRTFEGTALIEVQDTGVGIPPERQPTLFHAFRSIADRPASLQRGLGLGLSICRAIVDGMFGTIGVSSKVGRGSRFWFTVPLAASAQTVSSTRH
jgi:PAS domain S-box-containing protein